MTRVALGCSGAVLLGPQVELPRARSLWRSAGRLSPEVNDEAEHADARAAARTKALDSETRLRYSDQRLGRGKASVFRVEQVEQVDWS